MLCLFSQIVPRAVAAYAKFLSTMCARKISMKLKGRDTDKCRAFERSISGLLVIYKATSDETCTAFQSTYKVVQRFSKVPGVIFS